MKPCRRCRRSIDGLASLCPYCNWSQADVPPEPVPGSEPNPQDLSPAHQPEEVVQGPRSWMEDIDRGRLGKLALVFAGVVAALVGAFALGVFLYGAGQPDRGPEEQEESANVETRRDLPGLIPVGAASAGDPTGAAGREFQRIPTPDPDHKPQSEAEWSDFSANLDVSRGQPGATAPDLTPADPRKAARGFETRTIAPPSAGAAPSSGRSESGRSSSRAYVPPRPVSQPLPRVRGASRGGRIRFNLTVGSDGRVKEVEVLEAVPGVTPRMILAVQNWRFEPATRDGVAIEATFPAEISFPKNDG